MEGSNPTILMVKVFYADYDKDGKRYKSERWAFLPLHMIVLLFPILEEEDCYSINLPHRSDSFEIYSPELGNLMNVVSGRTEQR